MLRWGESTQINLQYSLPQNIIQTDNNNNYQLSLSKQAGIQNQPTHITITLPTGSQFIRAVPTPTSVEKNQITYLLEVDRDMIIDIEYTK